GCLFISRQRRCIMKPCVASCFLACLLALPCGAGAPGDSEPEPTYMGRTLRQWIADLKDADADVRGQAAYTLARMGPNIRPAFPALKEAAKDDAPGLLQYAAEALGNTGSQALPVLVELLESEDTRFAAMMGLQRMEQDPLPELLKRLAKGDVRQRRAVAAALRFWWQRSGEFRPALQRALNDP